MSTFDEVTGMNPSGKLNPSFREEDQHMAEELKPTVIGPPAFASPDPRTNSGKLVPLEEHPLSADISEDYGEIVAAERDVDTILSPMTPGDGPGPGVGGGSLDLPDNRDEYSKTDWQKVASTYGLSTSGNKNEIKDRVEAYEGELEHDREMTASEWVDEFNGAESIEDLQAMRARYDMAGADYSTAQSAYESKQAELEA